MFAASKCFSGYPPTPMQKYLSVISCPSVIPDLIGDLFSSERRLLYPALPWYCLIPSTSSLAYLYPPGVGEKRFSPVMLSPLRATMLLIPRNSRLSSLLSISSAVVPAQMMCGTVSTSYFDMIAVHTVVSLMRLRMRWRLNVPSASSRNSNSSLWLVTFMYFGLNSMKGAMLSRSSFLVMPLSGGTISSEGYAFVLFANISEIFIFWWTISYCLSIVYSCSVLPLDRHAGRASSWL